MAFPNSHLTEKILWQKLSSQCKEQLKEPFLEEFFQQSILNHSSIDRSASFILAHKLKNHIFSFDALQNIFQQVFSSEPNIAEIMSRDLQSVVERDSACTLLFEPLCFFKGFHALLTYRAMHLLWQQEKVSLAFILQNRASNVFDVDIHPAAKIGSGILFDHATGIVIGETAIIDDNVSIMQSVTLGGTGKNTGDRHPKIRKGALIGVGAKILGNIEIGAGAQVSTGSVVLKSVPAHTTVAGVPAIIVGKPKSAQPALGMEHKL